MIDTKKKLVFPFYIWSRHLQTPPSNKIHIETIYPLLGYNKLTNCRPRKRCNTRQPLPQSSTPKPAEVPLINANGKSNFLFNPQRVRTYYARRLRWRREGSQRRRGQYGIRPRVLIKVCCLWMLHWNAVIRRDWIVWPLEFMFPIF